MPDLGPHHVDVVGGVPTTSPARTLVDAGMVMPTGFVVGSMEGWLAHRVVRIPTWRDAVEEHAGKGRKGVGVLRRVLDERVLGDLVADGSAEARWWMR